MRASCRSFVTFLSLKKVAQKKKMVRILIQMFITTLVPPETKEEHSHLAVDFALKLKTVVKRHAPQVEE
jgi:hypothetical protein